MFSFYAHSGTSRESLHVFLFVKLIAEKKNVLSIDQYHFFELKENDVRLYNQWVEEGCPGKHKLINWLIENDDEANEFEKHFGIGFKPKVELWNDRFKTDYFKTKLQLSFEFEKHIENLLLNDHGLQLDPFTTPEGQYKEGENKLGIEIKNDTLVNKYGNVYIEYAEKSNASNSHYVDSGILKKDNTIYILIGDKEKFRIFRKKRLLEIWEEEQENIKKGRPSLRGIIFKTKSTSLGFVFPISHADKETISLELMVEELMRD